MCHRSAIVLFSNSILIQNRLKVFNGLANRTVIIFITVRKQVPSVDRFSASANRYPESLRAFERSLYPRQGAVE